MPIKLRQVGRETATSGNKRAAKRWQTLCDTPVALPSYPHSNPTQPVGKLTVFDVYDGDNWSGARQEMRGDHPWLALSSSVHKI